jgi:Ubiquitin-activating enzyme E1 FCCH domain
MSAANIYSAQGATLTIGVAAAAKTITAITKAVNAVLTFSAAHGFLGGEVVSIAAVGGMTEINGRTGVVRPLTTTTAELVGVDSSAFTTYTTGGTAAPSAAVVGNWKSWSGFSGQTSDIDVTDLSSTAMEYVGGLADNGEFNISVQTNDTDVGQQALQSNRLATGLNSVFTVTLKNGKKRTFSGYVKQFSEEGGVNNVLMSNIVIRISGAIVRS